MEATLEALKGPKWTERVQGLYWRSLHVPGRSADLVLPKSLVNVHYKAFIVKDDHTLEEIDSSFSGELGTLQPSREALSFTLGARSVIEAWEKVFTPQGDHQGVQVGDGIEILTGPAFGYGVQGSPPKVPGNATLLFQVFVVSTVAGKNRPSDYAEIAKKFKDQGNAFFQQQNYADAAATYTKALDALRFIFPEEENEQELINGIKLVVNLNRAACQLKLQDYAGAKQSCSDALYIDPTNVKALYRRAQAASATFDFTRAKNDIISAIKQSPSDTSLRQEFTRIRETEIDYDKRTQEAFAQMSKAAFKKS